MADYYIGLMSGTSMDGIDAALVDFSGKAPCLSASITHPWPPGLRQELISIAAGQAITAGTLSRIQSSCAAQFATACLQILKLSGINAEQITAIGSHGQTLYHGPDEAVPNTLQVDDPGRIVELTGITTVADFRRRDIAAGGQGAPLVPAFHQQQFSSSREPRVILNIGGIANITRLPVTGSAQVSGFDTGPGNCLMDQWISRHRQSRYDEAGQWAASGTRCETLLQQMLGDSYFQRMPAKSTGTQYFSPDWLDRQLQQHKDLPAADVQRTLLELTAHSIAMAIEQHAADTRRILVCGGGASNRVLMKALQAMATCPVDTTANFGVHPDWVEAIAFAWLARQTINGLPGNLSSVTGAAGPRILGAIYPA